MLRDLPQFFALLRSGRRVELFSIRPDRLVHSANAGGPCQTKTSFAAGRGETLNYIGPVKKA
jgi:hypothetical protein